MNVKQIHQAFQITGFCTAFPFSWDERFVFHGESHEMWEVIYLADGAVEITEDENIYTLSRGNMILHAPMEFHRIRSARGSAPSGFILSFMAEGSLPEALKDGPFTLTDEQQQAYFHISREILRFFEQAEPTDPYAGQAAGAMLSAFLLGLRHGQAQAPVLVKSASALCYQRLISAMTAAVEQNCSLAELAASCFVSVSYLKLLFRQYAGISPKAYYSHLRLQRAVLLLQQGLSIAAVAERMHFSSPNYFITFFKKQTGKTPAAYSRQELSAY